MDLRQYFKNLENLNSTQSSRRDAGFVEVDEHLVQAARAVDEALEIDLTLLWYGRFKFDVVEKAYLQYFDMMYRRRNALCFLLPAFFGLLFFLTPSRTETVTTSEIVLLISFPIVALALSLSLLLWPKFNRNVGVELMLLLTAIWAAILMLWIPILWLITGFCETTPVDDSESLPLPVRKTNCRVFFLYFFILL